MKKTNCIILGSLFMMAIASCDNDSDDGWIYGADPNGVKRDTVCDGNQYRYYGGGWYPIYTNGMIYPSAYGRGYNYTDIITPGFKAVPTGEVHQTSSGEKVTTAGFGSSAHASGGAEE